MNKKIIEQFEMLIKQINSEILNAKIENNPKEVSAHEFRLKSIQNVLRIIKKLDFEITDADDIKDIHGVGAGTIKRIKEILEKGYLSELESKYKPSKQKKIDSITQLETIIGIGPSIAKKLVVDHGIKSIDELKKAVQKGTVKVNDKVKLGLKYHGIVQGNIPRNEITDTQKFLKKEAKKIDKKLEVMVCGSYRRGKSTSGDIDLLMYHPESTLSKYTKNPKKYGMPSYLEEFVDMLKSQDFILDTIDKDYNTKYMGFSQYKDYPVRRIDIRFVPYESLYTAMLYFTGPFELNAAMREKAKKKNMILNEYGLFEKDPDGYQTKLEINSEKDVFEKLNMPYMTPEERENYSFGKKKL